MTRARKERSILFQQENIKLVFDGTKTQTRRPVKQGQEKCPYGEVGDLLWVKEQYAHLYGDIYEYKSTFCQPDNQPMVNIKWVSSRFMPKKAARVWLEILDVKKEPLNSISEEDAKAEGPKQLEILQSTGVNFAHIWRTSFCSLWDSIYEKKGLGWDTNPTCWAITFKRVER